MQINNINKILNFKSGLNKNILRDCSCSNISQIEMILSKRNIDFDSNQSKTTAYLVQSVINLLDNFKQKTGAKLFDITTPSISVYESNNLNFEFRGMNFCVPETQRVLNNKKKFKTGSLFFEKKDDIEKLNYLTDISYQKNERSSSHFLSTFIHEFMHNVYLNYIYLKYGYEGICKYTKQKYFSVEKPNNGLKILEKLQTLTFNEKENLIIENNIGKYATTNKNQYHEVFAETFTKLICESLSEDGTPQKNPIDLFKKLDPKFILILGKIFI